MNCLCIKKISKSFNCREILFYTPIQTDRSLLSIQSFLQLLFEKTFGNLMSKTLEKTNHLPGGGRAISLYSSAAHETTE